MKFVKAPVLFAFFAILVSFAAMASPGDSNSAGGNTITSATQPQDKADEWRHREIKAAEKSAHQDLYANWIGGIALILTLAMLVAAIKAALYAKESANAAKQALEDNEKYNKIQSRAYVGIVDIIAVNIKPNSIIDFHIEIKNYGKTPAYDFSIITELRPTYHQIESYKNYKFSSPGQKSKSCLWPDQQIGAFLQTKDPINENVYQQLYKNFHFIVFGYIKYSDIYKKTHRLTFCRYLDPHLIYENKSNLTYANKHNVSN